ncbi:MULTISPECIES: transposase [Thermaceae]|jgi:hypothetical protein|uniref:DDE superfamily endonuclease n=5 Tax=Thermaceae TaxID=188786 RepID=A0A399ELH0_9DEIN|nr:MULTISPECIES: transposase [Thermaceae]AGK03788.1 transposase IS4 family protein [Meiothermus ruber DSM 1279]MCX7739698.1 transposase [Meiothermus sp.]PZA07458.1 IS701 family transposase [Meiothermus sp. Pnk-1]RIH85574.1 DDE superfamily endonuclease [Calidithermus roseus]RIH90094.1 DDE superfamily endonuclease [Meiothermus luteus]
MVKGINFVSLLYHSQGLTLPVGYVLVEKTEVYVDQKSGQRKRRSQVSKNEHARYLLQTAVHNQIPFQHVLNDVWLASAANMRFIVLDMKKHFVMPLKSNRKVAPGYRHRRYALCAPPMSQEQQQRGQWTGVEGLDYQDPTPRQVYLEGVPFPLLRVRQVFTHEDGSQGVLYLCSSDTTLDFERMIELYQKRWEIERFHQSIRQNAALAKSPTKTLTTQANHFFAAMWAFVKLELLSHQTQINYFALKAKLYLVASRAAFQELQQIKAQLTA